MVRALSIGLVVCLIPAVALAIGKNLNYKIALYVLPHDDRSCDGPWPVIGDCDEIVTTYDGCTDFDVFPVFYDLVEVKRIEYGLTWPSQWGSCTFAACAGDNVEGDIVSPGDGMVHEWLDCQQVWSVVPGYAWFDAPPAPGIIALVTNPTTGSIGVTDCKGNRNLALGLVPAGVCGIPGENPCTCGCPGDPATWSAIKSLFKE